MSREAFEQWASGSFYLQRETSWYGDTPLETYQHESTQTAWIGWQAGQKYARSGDDKPVGKIYLITDYPEVEWYQDVWEGDLLYLHPDKAAIAAAQEKK